MSILIRNMEMPTSCRDCGIEQDGFWCGALDGYQNTRCFTNERREDCPLIEVPTPHGDLIDRDALKRNITANLPVAFQGFSVGLCNIVDMQKTIIEGEADG